MTKNFNLNKKAFLCLMLLSAIATLLAWQVFRVSAQKGNQQNAQANYEKVKSIADSPIFSEFDAWVKQYADGNFSADAAQSQHGESLAFKRRQLLKDLIQADPQAALEKAISVDDDSRLPDFITKNLEKRFSAYCDYNVYVIDEIDPTAGKTTGFRTEREIVIGDSRYKAFVYGRREEMTTKLNIPLRGILIEEVAAVDENFVQKIDSPQDESRSMKAAGFDQRSVAAKIGEKVVYFSNQAELDDFVSEQIDWESKIGPTRPNEKLAPNEPASTWTEGAKKVLYIRVDFSDRPGEPIDGQTGLPLTVQRAQEEMNKVNTVYTTSSYGKTSFQSVTVTPVIRLPQPASFYMPSPSVMNFFEIMADARNAARAAGFETNNFDLDVVASINNGVNAAGLGLIGAKGTWLLGYFNLGYPLHELGHNYGLNHSGIWRTTDGTVIGQGSETGGDVFDAMGYNDYGLTATHFMASDKRHLDWLTDANVQNITGDGVYRVFAQDAPNPSNTRLLRMKKDATRNYDVEFRQSITSNPNAMNGAIVRWHYPQARKAQLLDMTPNTAILPTGAADAPLLVGQSFFDNVNRIRITVLGKGSTVPESLDVKVELNIGCSFSLAQTTQNFAPIGGQGTVTVNTQSGCNPVMTSSDNWISITSSSAGTINYTVSANTTSQPRTGTISISGQTFTIQQASCSFSLGQTSQSFAASGGAGVFAVNTQSGCSPAAASGVNWIFVINTNSGSVNYIVAANYSSQPRTGIITISGQTHTVQQSAAVTACAARPSGLAAWWRAEGNALDETGVNNGTIQTGMSYSTGKVGGGFKGAGTPNSNRIYVPDSPSLALNRSLSVEGWIRSDALGNYVIITRGDDRDYNGSYAVSFFNGNILFGVTPAPNSSGVFVGSASPVPVNQFVHFAGTLDDVTGQMKFYINGSLVNQRVTAIRPYRELDATKNPRIAIGNLAHSGLTFDSFNGVIDELAVYNRALSAAEIQTIYNAGTAATGAAGKCLEAQSPRVKFDFDGDAKADISVFRPSNGVWYLQNSASGFSSAQFGLSNDKIVPADYDGDGKTDVAVFRGGAWYLMKSTEGFSGVQFGQSGDVPQPADYDGDGKADIAVFRPSNGVWYLLRSSQGFTAAQFGASVDKPAAADYDGDGKADIAVYRDGIWYLQQSSQGFTAISFGVASDKPVPADYDGDGKADVTVYRSSGVWYQLRSQLGFTAISFGAAEDRPAAGDYDGDGKTDVAVWRPSNGVFYVLRSQAGFTAVGFGQNGDAPIASAYVP